MTLWDGILVLDKPSGMTSRDVVNQVQRLLPRKTRLGHAGTLDPLATGVLVIAIGKATRVIEYLQAMSKSYRTRLHLGATSDTDDADGRITANTVRAWPELSTIDRALLSFVGLIEQTPPAYSAALIDGRRAYSLARQGAEVELAPRQIRIDHVASQWYEPPLLDLAIDCGKGTYIRSLGRDLGECLGVGAYVETLRRSRIGPFDEQTLLPIPQSVHDIAKGLRPWHEALGELPSQIIGDDQARRVLNGMTVFVAEGLADAPEVAIFTEQQQCLGVGLLDEGWIKPLKVIK